MRDYGRPFSNKLLTINPFYKKNRYEALECLHQCSIDNDDKSFLKDTLDTLKDIKLRLKDNKFTSSKKRPIESSFRMYQPHHVQMMNQTEKQHNHVQPNSNLSQVSQQPDISSSNTRNMQALASNVNVLTNIKWEEIEANVDAFSNSSLSNSSASMCLIYE